MTVGEWSDYMNLYDRDWTVGGGWMGNLTWRLVKEQIEN